MTGDPTKEGTQLGPIVDKAQFDKVMGFIEAGKKDTDLVTGGARIGDKGNFIEPTIFKTSNPKAKVVQEEIFGPVVTVTTFKTEEEVIEAANNTEYGLSCKLHMFLYEHPN